MIIFLSKNHLIERALLSTHNIYFGQETRKSFDYALFIAGGQRPMPILTYLFISKDKKRSFFQFFFLHQFS